MDHILQPLLTLVEKGSVEQRCATLVVLGALKAQNAEVVKVAGALLDQDHPILKDYALRYFEEAQPKAAVPLLLRLLEDSDQELQERAIRLLTRAGPAAVEPILRRAPAASRGWQLNAARVLCSVRGKAAFQGVLQMLRAGTDEFNKAVCDALGPAIRDTDPREQEVLYHEVEAMAAKLDAGQQRAAVISAIRLFGQLGRPQARRWLFQFVAPEQPPTLRSHAVVALLRCLRDQELRREEHAQLIRILEEKEFTEVTRLALELLDARPLAEEARPLLSRLMQSPHEGVQKFALRKMGDFGTPAAVRTLVEQLGDPDYRRREVAARSLHKIPEARGALIKELMSCGDASKAWSIAELLPSYEGKWRQEVLEALWKRLCTAMAVEDRIQTAFLHVLKQANPEYGYQQLANHAAKLVKSKKYRDALPFLSALKDFPQIKPEDKFRFALAQFKSHSAASRRQQPAIDLLIELYRSSAYPLYESLKKERSLAPDDLFQLGFSLVERPGDERNLGKDLLKHLATSVPRTKIGKSAKNKLKLLAG